jgi:hypothetical protein
MSGGHNFACVFAGRQEAVHVAHDGEGAAFASVSDDGLCHVVSFIPSQRLLLLLSVVLLLAVTVGVMQPPCAIDVQVINFLDAHEVNDAGMVGEKAFPVVILLG